MSNIMDGMRGDDLAATICIIGCVVGRAHLSSYVFEKV